ncbi:class I SAM-dependent methyltransferase [Bradyrhizobium arachidis]|uniref:class I SAM-dependent methyltransferase n=1 Tax=Bradyrhizobium TaxID=374 RepID=UPI0021621E7F|nr:MULTISPECIES: class I SAM-dependent methyltransferase [Bradyrhizobium]MDN4988173.1 class I SAM-dependent methyltransferase [Bradyrhizobium sp. WYCCWR 13022]UVO35427.1 class I SAM-dependent methyltransferase [Bradyrhizobium arachidis]
MNSSSMEQPAPDATSRYRQDDYAVDNPDWHEEDAPWKAAHIRTILDRNRLQWRTLADIGCGTGAIVEILSRQYPQSRFEGFEVSPYAHELSLKRASDNLGFSMEDAFQSGKQFDLAMAIDVAEHVENPFEFLRAMGRMSRWQVIHVPLDMSALAVGRGWVLPAARRTLGHIHYFSRDSALSLIAESGLETIDSFYTAWAIDQSYKTWKKRLAAWPRRLAFLAAPDATVRLVGGWSLMVLSRSKLP